MGNRLQVYKSTRGLELSGSYNHTVLSSLFHEQASRWPEIARTHVEVVHSRITAFLNRTLAHVVKEEALRFRLQRIISNSSERLLHDALDELVKICNDEEMQPLTYNHYFTDNVQNARQDSMKSAIEKAFKGATNSGKATLDSHKGRLCFCPRSKGGSKWTWISRRVMRHALPCWRTTRSPRKRSSTMSVGRWWSGIS